jgi:hypothetical protein
MSDSLEDRLHSILRKGLKNTGILPSDAGEHFLSVAVDDILDEVYKFDMKKFGGRNSHRRRLRKGD